VCQYTGGKFTIRDALTMPTPYDRLVDAGEAAFEGTCALSNWRPNTETECRPPKSEFGGPNPSRWSGSEVAVEVSSRSRSIPTDSLGIPTCAGQFVTRSEELPTHSLPLPRDGTARPRFCRGVVHSRTARPRPTARLRLRRSVVETRGRGVVNTRKARPRLCGGLVKSMKRTP
jgi:hypothetical protein